MFKWAECRGCDEFDREDGKECAYDGRYWECPYAEGIQEDLNRGEDF